MFIHTQSGSIYEIDQSQSRARRLIGNGPPTSRVGETWREYADLHLDVGQDMVIVWEYVIENGQIVARSTMTSKVLRITEDLEIQ